MPSAKENMTLLGYHSRRQSEQTMGLRVGMMTMRNRKTTITPSTSRWLAPFVTVKVQLFCMSLVWMGAAVGCIWTDAFAIVTTPTTNKKAASSIIRQCDGRRPRPRPSFVGPAAKHQERPPYFQTQCRWDLSSVSSWSLLFRASQGDNDDDKVVVIPINVNDDDEENDDDGWGASDEKGGDDENSSSVVTVTRQTITADIIAGNSPTTGESQRLSSQPPPPERDLFIPIFSLVSLAGLMGAYGYEMLRLYSRGELYLPWN
jgi:hypothetical protein